MVSAMDPHGRILDSQKEGPQFSLGRRLERDVFCESYSLSKSSVSVN
jgi:hypothetical protein